MQDVCKCVNRSNKMRCKVRAGARFRRGWLQRIACANPKVNSQIVNSQSCNSRGKKSRMGPPRRSFLVFDHLIFDIFGVDNFALCLYMPWQNQSSTPQSITGFSPSMAEPLFPCHPMILQPEHLTHRRRPFFGSETTGFGSALRCRHHTTILARWALLAADVRNRNGHVDLCGLLPKSSMPPK